MNSTTLLACATLLLPCTWQAHAAESDAADLAPAPTFITYKQANPPAAVKRILAARAASRATHLRQPGKGYRATMAYAGAAPIEFVSGTPEVSYGGGAGTGVPEERQSTGLASPGPWGASRHQLTNRFQTEGFTDGVYTLGEGSYPGMSYSLVFEQLPGMPGWGGFVSYEAQGETSLRWDPANESASGSYDFKVLVEAAPPSWGIGPDQDYLLEVAGDFVD